MKTLEELTNGQIKSKAGSDARMRIDNDPDFRKLSKNDLLHYTRRFQILLHHLKSNGFNEQKASEKFLKDRKEALEKYTKENQLNIIKAQQAWKENAKQAWELFKRTIAPYYNEEMMKWNSKFHDDEVSRGTTESIEECTKELFLNAITSDYTSLNQNDFKRKLIKNFESREFTISLDRQLYMNESDALELRERARRHEDSGELFFKREVTLKPRLRR